MLASIHEYFFYHTNFKPPSRLRTDSQNFKLIDIVFGRPLKGWLTTSRYIQPIADADLVTGTLKKACQALVQELWSPTTSTHPTDKQIVAVR